ncbi:MAG: DNA polymerase/3'-5' exonuclease PolX [Deltaproteobacteria bacterium]|nr:DNA polymerase/3'-5' exonuclease PolX [Deltaproteobacteria bacterium]
MPVQNSDVSDIFNKVADLLEIEDESPFRIRAYRNAARIIANLPQNVSDRIESESDLTELRGIGKDLAGKIKEIVETGSLAQLEELEGKTPSGLSQLMKLEGIGPKRVKALNRDLGVTSLKDLEEAARQGKVKEVKGFGEKTQQKILEELEAFEEQEARIKLIEAEQRAKSLVDYLKEGKGIKEITVAGSYRRRKETVGDLDILVTCRKGASVMDRFVHYEDVKKVVSKGTTRATVVLRSGLHVDLRVVPQVSYGAALHYFTGSKAHNIAVRKLGVKKNLKINEYGVFKGDERIAGKTEKEVYDQVDLPYIEPELRENRGELEAAGKGRLPRLIGLDDLRGDLHAHTTETDGHATLEEMANAAKDYGHDYLAITNHSKKVTMAHGLDAGRLAEEIEEIDQLNGKLADIVLLKGIEVDILEDGSLDLPDDILKELDVVVCSVHYQRRLSREKMTERVLRAMDNPYTNIFAHPTGRLINARDPYEIDLERIIRGAKERGCFLEINAHPDRLDLSDVHCKMAKDMGLKLAISTDAHSIADLNLMQYGIDQARRGWVEPDDVINTRDLKQLRKLLKRT